MTKKLLKYFGLFILFCILLIGKVFITEILLPALNQPKPTKPSLKSRLPQHRFFDETLIPTREQPHPTKLTTISHLIQQVVSSLAFTPDGKQLLGLQYLTGHSEIMRWSIEDGTALPPVTNPKIRLLSDDGRFYVISNFSKGQGSNQRLYRVSDQKLISVLPNNTQNRSLIKITAGANPSAIYYYVNNTAMDDPFSRPKDVKHGYLIWDIQAKRFISSTPYLTTLYGSQDDSSLNVAFSNDGKKALSLWPTYSGIGMGKTITFTQTLNPWPGELLTTTMKPKGAHLLNEINGKTIILPYPDKNYNYRNAFFEWDKAALSLDQKFFVAASSNYNGTIWCYDISNRRLKWKHSQDLTFPDTLMFSPDRTMVAVGGNDANYRWNGFSFLNVIDVKRGKLLHSYTEQTLSQQIRDRTRIYFLEKLRRFAFRFRRYASIERWRTRISLSEGSPAAPGNSGRIQAIAWSPDSKSLAASYEDGSVKLWSVNK